MKVSILVLLYDVEIFGSKTIQGIVSSKFSFTGTDIVIWNNGPKPLNNKNTRKLEEKGLAVSIIETIENISLSVIYNKFIVLSKSDFYVFLDHDSSVTDQYLRFIKNAYSSFMFVPLVYCKNIIISPSTSSNVKVGMNVSNNNNFIAITSGLIINKKILEILKSNYGNYFDEKFYFYGVDTTLFYRLAKLNLLNNINIIDGFEHSLSSREVENDSISYFRLIENSYSFGLKLRYYPSVNIYYQAFKAIKRVILNDSKEISFGIAFKAIVSGKHYKN